MKQILQKITIFLLLALLSLSVEAAPRSAVDEQTKTAISKTLTRIVQREIKGVGVTVSSVNVKGNKLRVFTSVSMSYYPVREDNLRALCDSVRLCLPHKLKNKQIVIYSDGHPLDYYIP